MSDPAVRALSRRLAALEAGQSKRGTQLEHSALEDGALREFDLEGQQVAQYGKQYDGTSTAAVLVSPPPPVPTSPVASGVPGGINVLWDGLYADDPLTVAPMDFARVDVVVGPVGFDPLITPPIASITSPRGGVVFCALVPGTYEVRLVTRTQAGRPSTPSAGDTADALEVALAIALAAVSGVADDALAAANGKNAISHQDFDPTTEPNTVGDVWFTHDTTSGAIVGQWTGMGGTAWQQTTISHQVISSIDLGTATVGKLTANYIESGVLSAALTVTGYLIAGNPVGARVIIDDAGIRQYGPTGETLVTLPTNGDPAQFEGTITASSALLSALSIMGVDNVIPRGGVLTVQGTTADPTVAPTVQAGYEKFITSQWAYLYVPTGMHSNTDDTDGFNGASTFFGYGKFLGKAGRWYHFPEVTDNTGSKRSKYGNISNGVGIHTAAGAERFITYGYYTAANGSTPVGSIDSWDMDTMNNSGTAPPALKAHLNTVGESYVFSARFGRVFSPVGSTLYKERFALLFWNWNGGVYGDGLLTLRQYSVVDVPGAAPGTSAGYTQIGSNIIISNPHPTNALPIGVTHGSWDKLGFPGAAQYVWLIHYADKTYAFNATASTRIPDFDFPTPPGAARMFAHGDVATNEFLGFRTTEWDDTSPVAKLTNDHWIGATSSKWWVVNDWQDIDPTTGLHHTRMGPPAPITMPKRAGVFVTIPTYPARPFPTTTDDPLAANVYVARGASAPGRTDYDLVGQLAAPNRGIYIKNRAFPGSPSNPPAASGDFNTSAFASPGKIQSADGIGWVLAGDGKATIAGVEFDAAFPGLASAAMRSVEFRYTDATDYGISVTTYSDCNARGGRGTFVAPPSGVVKIEWSVLAKSGTLNQYVSADVEVRTGGSIGSGTVVRSCSPNDSALNFLTSYVTIGHFVVLTGLTPGAVYNARMMYRTNPAGNAATLVRGRMIVTPSP